MRIYYNAFSTITRYLFHGSLEAIGEISLTPEPILLNSLVCYYEDLEEGKSFRGDFENPKIYKQYVYEICDKYRDTYIGEGCNELMLKINGKIEHIIPMPNDLYTTRKVYLLGKLIKEDKFYHNKLCPKGFYKTDEMIEYYKKKGELDSL